MAAPKGISLPPPPQIGVDCPPVVDGSLPIVGAAGVPFLALTAVHGCRDMPHSADTCRSLERKLLIFQGLGFFFEPEGDLSPRFSYLTDCLFSDLSKTRLEIPTRPAGQ